MTDRPAAPMVLTRHKASSELSGRALLTGHHALRPPIPRSRLRGNHLPHSRPGSGRGGPPGAGLARRRRGSPIPPGHVLDGRQGRGQVPVPDQRRRRHELAGPRRGQGQLLHSQHARDTPQDDPERDVLLAGARDQRRRRGLGVDAAPRVPQAVEPAAGAPEPELGRSSQLPGQSGRAQLGGRRRRCPLPGLGRERPDARLARPALRQPGRLEWPAERRRQLRGDHLGAVTRLLLLERRAGRRRGQPRCRYAGRLVQLAVAFRDRDSSRGSERCAGGIRSALLLGPGSGCGSLRG